MFFFFQAEDGIRDLVRSRGLGDVYKRQAQRSALMRLRRDGITSEEVFETLVAELDASLMNKELLTFAPVVIDEDAEAAVSDQEADRP